MVSLQGKNIELVSGRMPAGCFKSALFDFDGTLSLIREGWQQVMIPFMVEEISTLGTGEPIEEIRNVVLEYVERLTGKQTIYQMMQLAEEIEKRGGRPQDPLAYKQIYHDRLWERIKDRVAGLKSGEIEPERVMVEGSGRLLEGLRLRDVELYLASGTDESYVEDEAAALGLTPYFGDRIYGARDDYKSFSKAILIQRILEEHGLAGESLIVFGDGYVEIENCRSVNGYAVGVASDEANRRGIDEWKRRRLISAGADIIVGDYTEVEALLAFLFAKDALSEI